MIASPCLRRRSCGGVARGTASCLQMSRMVTATSSDWPNTKSSPMFNPAIMSCTDCGNHTGWVTPFLVPFQPVLASGAPGKVHQPSVIWSYRIRVTSPGLWPVSNRTCNAIPGITGLTERLPEQRHLSVTQYSLPSHGGVALYAATGVVAQ